MFKSKLLLMVPLCLMATGVCAEPDKEMNPAASMTVEAAKQKFIGNWYLFAAHWGSWNHEFRDAVMRPDGVIQLEVLDHFNPAKPRRLIVEVAGDGLVFHYNRPQCKGMPDVTENGTHLMKFKPIDDTGTKYEATMISRDCSTSAKVQLVRK